MTASLTSSTLLHDAAAQVTGSKPASPRNRDSLLRSYLSPAPRFDLVSASAPERQEVEAFVGERYQSAYQARLSQFLPWLLSMRCLGQLSGVAGLRPADQQALFLEQYLDQNVEHLLSERSGGQVTRSSIVEIGNLAAERRGASHLLFLVFTAVLQRAGYEWIVFTATKGLRNNLEKLGFPLMLLQDADAGRMDPHDRAAWGSYYDSEPQVVAGRLSAAMELIQSRALLRRVLRMYRYQINALASELGAK